MDKYRDFECMNHFFQVIAVLVWLMIFFDLETSRENFTLVSKDDSGSSEILQCNQRYYDPTEIS